MDMPCNYNDKIFHLDNRNPQEENIMKRFFLREMMPEFIISLAILASTVILVFAKKSRQSF